MDNSNNILRRNFWTLPYNVCSKVQEMDYSPDEKFRPTRSSVFITGSSTGLEREARRSPPTTWSSWTGTTQTTPTPCTCRLSTGALTSTAPPWHTRSTTASGQTPNSWDLHQLQIRPWLGSGLVLRTYWDIDTCCYIIVCRRARHSTFNKIYVDP